MQDDFKPLLDHSLIDADQDSLDDDMFAGLAFDIAAQWTLAGRIVSSARRTIGVGSMIPRSAEIRIIS